MAPSSLPKKTVSTPQTKLPAAGAVTNTGSVNTKMSSKSLKDALLDSSLKGLLPQPPKNPPILNFTTKLLALPCAYESVHPLPKTEDVHTLTLHLSTPTQHTVTVLTGSDRDTVNGKVDQDNPTLSLLVPSSNPLILRYESTSFPKPTLNLLPLPPSTHTTMTSTETSTTISTTKGFPSFHLPLSSPSPYFYTCKILTPGLAQIGFSTPSFSPSSAAGKGCGDCENSYGFDGSRVFKWHSGGTRWGSPWSANSIITLAYSPQKGQIYCSVDGHPKIGSPQSIMFSNVFKDLRPCLTLNKSCKILVTFTGTLPGFSSVSDCISSTRPSTTLTCKITPGENLTKTKTPPLLKPISTIPTLSGPQKVSRIICPPSSICFGDVISSQSPPTIYELVRGCGIYKKPKAWRKGVEVEEGKWIWEPVGEEGYVGLGCVVRGGVEEGVEGVVCVREDWVEKVKGRGKTVEIESPRKEGSGTGDAKVYTMHVTPSNTFLIKPYGSQTYEAIKKRPGEDENSVAYGSETMEILKGLKTSDDTSLIKSIIESLREGVDEMLKLGGAGQANDPNFIVIINLLTNLLRSRDLESGFGSYLRGVVETVDGNCKKGGKFYAPKHARKLIEMCIVGSPDPDFKLKPDAPMEEKINELKTAGVRILSSCTNANTNASNSKYLSDTLIRLYNSVRSSFKPSTYWKLMSWFETFAVSTFRSYSSTFKAVEDIKLDGSKKLQIIIDPRSRFSGGKLTFSGTHITKRKEGGKETLKPYKITVDDSTNKKFYSTRIEFEGANVNVAFTPKEAPCGSTSPDPVFSFIVHGMGIVNSYKLRKFLTAVDKYGTDIDSWEGVISTKRWSSKEDSGIVKWLNKGGGKEDTQGGRRHVFDMNVTADDLEGGSLGFLAQGGAEIYGLRFRIACLRHFNEAVERAVHLVDVEDGEEGSLGERLRAFSGRIAEEGKERRLKVALEATQGTGGNNTTVILDNFLASKSLDNVGIASSNCIFVQAFKDLNKKPASVLRSVWDGDRVFQVSFRGESGSDAGGVFREGMQRIVEDLFCDYFDLFIGCPNNLHDINLNREKFLPNSKHIGDATAMQMYNFVGKIMGSSLRTNLALPFHFPSYVWKGFCGLKLDREDIVEVDSLFEKWLRDISECTEEMWEWSYGEEAEQVLKWTCTGAAGNELTVRDDPNPVPFALRNVYVEEVIKLRHAELEPALSAMKTGMFEVVPERALALFTWREVEVLVCGNPTFDMEDWKNHSHYSGYSSDDDVIKTFWKVMEEITDEEKSMFCRFVWGRSRLPAKGQPWTTNFHITKRGSVDALPQAHTCFNSLELPPYGTEDLLREKLLCAVRYGVVGILNT
ncbi:hypothetical protein TrVE_jg14152 [Triparma verrucosa]|uniref:HECT domain-containing protein n=1 Tax=Triparma verrucosa TaxID=1606542 RepID=A0A9W7C3W2_9STRA|nr:hypothetical protein TrVE_jg14152 [Triparma verrucosa]